MRVLLDLRISKSAADDSDAQRALALTFSKALAQALHEKHDTHVLLDGRFSESVDEVRGKLLGILPSTSIHVWQSLPMESLQTAAAHSDASGRRTSTGARSKSGTTRPTFRRAVR